MSVLDLVLLSLLVFGLTRGFIRGFFVELASVIALVAGIYGAFNFSNYMVAFLKDKVEWSENTINIVALIVTFTIIVLVIGLAGKALTKIADFAMLGLLNKILGAAFGCLKTVLILSVLLIVVDKMNANILFITEKDRAESVLYNPIKSFVPTIFPNIIVNGKPLGEDLFNEDVNEE